MTTNERLKRVRCSCFAVLIVLFYGLSLQGEPAKRPLTFRDIMKFKEIHNPAISDDGNWVVYNAQPDRGNGQVLVHNVITGKSVVIERGIKPLITKDGKWVAAFVKPDALTVGKTKDEETLKQGLVLLETAGGPGISMERVKDFAFSEDSQWLVYQLFPEEKKGKPANQAAEEEEKEEGEAEEEKDKKRKKNEWEKKAAPFIMRHLPKGRDIRVENVISFAIDPASRCVVYSTYTGGEAAHGIYFRDLKNSKPVEQVILEAPGAVFNNLSWSKKKSRLAFLFHYDTKKSKNKNPDKNKKHNKFAPGLYFWDGLTKKRKLLVGKTGIPAGWMLPAENRFTWTEDEERLYFGFKPIDEYRFYKKEDERDDNNEKIAEKDIFSPGYILKKRTVDVWHYLDPRINPRQKKMWERDKKRTYLAVYHLKQKRFVRLADRAMPQVRPVENGKYALGFSRVPYMREMTWDGRYEDVYLVDLEQGTREKILVHNRHDVSLSPGGNFIAYYKDRHWFLFDSAGGNTRNLTAAIQTPFSNEDHDYPSAVPGYGIAGWSEKDKALFIYDKYDIWQFPTSLGKAVNLTAGKGREEQIAFRIITTDPQQKFFKKDQPLLLSAYSHEEKYAAFYGGRVGQAGVEKLIAGPKRFTFIKKANYADRMLFTCESFSEFPDLWVSDSRFTSPQKISEVNPRIRDFLWGTPRLIEWRSLDGIRLQGIVILPENYDKNKRYPVLVYFYRFFTDRLYTFNRMVVNHRPNFPFYVSNGYVMFLPDVRFQVGQPGYSAAKCVVTGVQKLIDMGIADPKAVALHGHSWSGYQTAFIITRTDIFAAAIAGALVSNMTSAYSGVRWNSGLARQFQYEKSQSRIGKSLWEAPRLYIENSPVFFADRINTPLLIQHGDRDGAVPWYQAIELYLAMRRLNKNCIFLQYNDEPHHLKKYANKLDYSIKMKEFLDYHLKGEPAPAWIKTGVPYNKNDE